MPDFEDIVILETDASGVGLGAVLMQKDHPIAFINQKLKGRTFVLSAYEKEIMAILLAVKK